MNKIKQKKKLKYKQKKKINRRKQTTSKLRRNKTINEYEIRANAHLAHIQNGKYDSLFPLSYPTTLKTDHGQQSQYECIKLDRKRSRKNVLSTQETC